MQGAPPTCDPWTKPCNWAVCAGPSKRSPGPVCPKAPPSPLPTPWDCPDPGGSRRAAGPVLAFKTGNLRPVSRGTGSKSPLSSLLSPCLGPAPGWVWVPGLSLTLPGPRGSQGSSPDPLCSRHPLAQGLGRGAPPALPPWKGSPPPSPVPSPPLPLTALKPHVTFPTATPRPARPPPDPLHPG